MHVSDFLSRLASPLTGEELFDHLNDVVYFVKDISGAYVIVNRTLVKRCGAKSKQMLIGKTPRQVLGESLGRLFEEQDLRVLSTGRPLLSQLELHLYPDNVIGWCLTTKLPLRDRAKKIIGLMGVSQDLRLPNVETQEYQQVAEAIQFAEERLETPPKISEMASRAGMSIYQLDRRIKHVYGLTTGQWLLKTRIDRAQQLLQESPLSIAGIAGEVGYADQSAFSRQFRSATGFTPRAFREASQRASR